jgi:uncharacterized protein YutE (UPF0331/DUF86 family)
MEYDAYIECMKRIGNTKVQDITADAEKYAAYMKRMAYNQVLLEDIQKQLIRTAELRKQIVGLHKKRGLSKWARIVTVEDE